MYCRMDEDLERVGKEDVQDNKDATRRGAKAVGLAPVNPNLEVLENYEGDLDGRRP